ncbi:MAG: ribbon-helix-helix protein, CopG family [Candidatus Aenigmarchaeota archaeon]|nr:ribbon-helix-helix protein, CopG family [Candidatus Aenigmarchaeota archaeon]
MVQVQLRVPEESIKDIDKWVKAGRFKSRSDAIKTMISFYEEKERTREFLSMLLKRSEEAKDKKMLIRLDEVK